MILSKKIYAALEDFLNIDTVVLNENYSNRNSIAFENFINSSRTNEEKLKVIRKISKGYLEHFLYHTDPVGKANFFNIVKKDSELSKFFIMRKENNRPVRLEFFEHLTNEDKIYFLDVVNDLNRENRNHGFKQIHFKDLFKIITQRNCNAVIQYLLVDRKQYYQHEHGPYRALDIAYEKASLFDRLRFLNFLNKKNINDLLINSYSYSYHTDLFLIFSDVKNDHALMRKLFSMLDPKVIDKFFSKEYLRSEVCRDQLLYVIYAVSSEKALLKRLMDAALRSKYKKLFIELLQTSGEDGDSRFRKYFDRR